MQDSQPRRSRGRPKAWADKTEQNTIKSLDRAMDVLEHLSTLPGVTLSELASNLDQSPATVYRVLVTLEGRGLVEFDAEAQLWHVGSQAFVIGARYLRRTSLVDRAASVLRQLMAKTGETANLAVPRDGSVVFVSQVECHHSIRAFFPPGSASPMHASGVGKALLAEMPAAMLERVLGDGTLERFTEHTMADRDMLMTELKRTRTRGFAIDDQEKNIGMRCIAAPVLNWTGDTVAGISISGPVARIGDGDIPALAQAVMEAARGLSAALGSERNGA
ncbi:IclR family transcriptional regulator [Tateyamaria omphalii]|uniref:HTH-type transcriptional regulator BhcR n=1 Tax=Tateyamaria omphalii TaxID=299262 RepID=UPI00167C40F9|nr:HTH-type transcriptional regulator BhcR [Tateyamaria omphalii]GGX49974.1 IclR family transcriptional regulator [Tateyamaria omphalii]